MKLYIGADHGGYELKNQLAEHLRHSGHEVIDVGAKTLDETDDYPRYAYFVAVKVLGEEVADGRGILICRSGQGMSIAANRVRGIRAGLCWNVETAVHAKRDDNANVLVLPSDFMNTQLAMDAVDAWLATDFKNDPKYSRRLDELEELYG